MLRLLATQALARRSAQRPCTTVLTWAALIVVAGLLTATLFSDAITTAFTFTNTPEAQRGVDLLEELRGQPLSTNEVVIIRSDNLHRGRP